MYICCHRAGKAKDLYSRSFLLDESRHREKMREWREKGRMEEERERGTERSCIGRARRGLSREWQKERKDDRDEMGGKREREREKEGERRGRWTEGGRGGGQKRGSRRTGRINKRNAPPSHLRHLYFAAPHGRKSSSVSERGDTARRGEKASKKGGREYRAGKGSRPPSSRSRPTLVINPFPWTIRLCGNDRARSPN